jgi:hypothetical protein
MVQSEAISALRGPINNSNRRWVGELVVRSAIKPRHGTPLSFRPEYFNEMRENGSHLPLTGPHRIRAAVASCIPLVPAVVERFTFFRQPAWVDFSVT